MHRLLTLLLYTTLALPTGAFFKWHLPHWYVTVDCEVTLIVVYIYITNFLISFSALRSLLFVPGRRDMLEKIIQKKNQITLPDVLVPDMEVFVPLHTSWHMHAAGHSELMHSVFHSKKQNKKRTLCLCQRSCLPDTRYTHCYQSFQTSLPQSCFLVSIPLTLVTSPKTSTISFSR